MNGIRLPNRPGQPRRSRLALPVLIGALVLVGAAVVLVAGIGVFRQGAAPEPKLPGPHPTAAPNDPVAAALVRGDDAFEREDYAGSVLAYSDAITLNPSSAEAYNNRGLAHYRLNDLAAALDDYNRALALRPDYANALTNRAIALFDRGEYTAVIADTSRAIELDPSADSAYVFRGNAYMRQGDYARGLADFLKANSIRMGRRGGGL